MLQIPPYFRTTLALQRSQIPSAWILIVGTTTLIPLLAGLLTNHPDLGIFGGLTGYCLGVCTESGPLSHRLRVAALAFFVFTVDFYLGVFLRPFPTILYALSLVMTYATGLLAGKGRELERILILGGVHFYVAWYARLLVPAAMPSLMIFPAIAFATLLVANSVVSMIWPLEREPFVRIRDLAAEWGTRDRARHYYALTYAAAILFSILLVEFFNIERGYWTVITTLLIMKPTRRESLQRVTQRIFGTLVGVAIGKAIVAVNFPPLALVFFAAGFAALVPFVWSRNYWLVALCASAFVISLLDLAAHGFLPSAVALVRVNATLLGCGVSLVTILLFETVRAKT